MYRYDVYWKLPVVLDEYVYSIDFNVTKKFEMNSTI